MTTYILLTCALCLAILWGLPSLLDKLIGKASPRVRFYKDRETGTWRWFIIGANGRIWHRARMFFPSRRAARTHYRFVRELLLGGVVQRIVQHTTGRYTWTLVAKGKYDVDHCPFDFSSHADASAAALLVAETIVKTPAIAITRTYALPPLLVLPKPTA